MNKPKASRRPATSSMASGCDDLPRVSQKAVDALFDRLAQLHGAHWHRRCREMGWGTEENGQWVSCDAEGEWLAALSHLSAQHLRCGLQAEKARTAKSLQQRGNAFPPDSAMQFAELCQMTPEGLGLPDFDTAWQALQDHAFTGKPYPHEAIAAAGEHMDLHGMASASYQRMDKHERAFRVYYQQVVERFARGEDLKPQAAIGHDGQLSPAERAVMAGQARAQQQAEAAGLPHTMNADQGMRSLRAALKGA